IRAALAARGHARLAEISHPGGAWGVAARCGAAGNGHHGAGAVTTPRRLADRCRPAGQLHDRRGKLTLARDSRLPAYSLRRPRSAVGARHPGNTGHLDPLVRQRFGILRGRLPVDGPLFALATMDLAGLIREGRSDVVAVGFHLGSHALQHRREMRRHRPAGGHRRLPRGLRRCRSHLAAGLGGGLLDRDRHGGRFPRRYRRRHQRAGNLCVAAGRAFHESPLRLLLERGAVLEPAVELVVLAASQLVVDHSLFRRTRPEPDELAQLGTPGKRVPTDFTLQRQLRARDRAFRRGRGPPDRRSRRYGGRRRRSAAPWSAPSAGWLRRGPPIRVVRRSPGTRHPSWSGYGPPVRRTGTRAGYRRQVRAWVLTLLRNSLAGGRRDTRGTVRRPALLIRDAAGRSVDPASGAACPHPRNSRLSSTNA